MKDMEGSQGFEYSFKEDQLIDIVKSFKHRMDQQKGYVEGTGPDGSPCKIYSPFVMALLSLHETEVYNRKTKQNEVITGAIFNKSYFNGFNDGTNLLETEFGITFDKLSSPGFETHVENLRRLYYEGTQEDSSWISWNNIADLVVTEKLLYNLGKYAGLVYKTDSYAGRLLAQFEGFRKVDSSDEIEVAKKPNKRTGNKRGAYKGSKEKRRKLVEYYYQLVDSGVSYTEARLKATTACGLGDQTLDSALEEFPKSEF